MISRTVNEKNLAESFKWLLMIRSAMRSWKYCQELISPLNMGSLISEGLMLSCGFISSLLVEGNLRKSSFDHKDSQSEL